MEKFKFSRKVLPLILAMMLVISSFPISVAYAADSKLASVSVYTNPSKAVIDDSEQSNIVVNYNDSFNLDWIAKDASIGITKDGWGIGIKVIAPTGPEGYTVSELKDSKFQTRFHGKTDWSDVNFWNSQDSDSSSDDESIERFVGIWDYVDESELNDAKNNGENIVSDFRFDWNNDGTFEQSVTLNIDPEKINLYKESVKVYPSDNLGSVSAITEPSAISVDGSETNNVTVTNTSDITLNWSQKDDSIGRAKDGWWLGVKVSAPSGMGKTELENAKLQFKAHGKKSWTDAGNFWDIRDSGNSSSVWTGLWLYVDQTMKDAGSTIVNYARIDWNGDGVYEQTVKVSLNPEKLSLDPTNLYAMDTEAPEFSEDTTSDAIVWVNDEVEIAGKAIDKGTVNNGTTYTSGTEKVEYARGSETGTRTEATFDETTNGFSFTVKDEFLGRYYIFSTDKAGNESSYNVLIKLDNKKPTLSNVAADVTDWTKNGVEISGEAADTLSGVEKIVYKLGESGAEQEVSVDTSDEGKTATFTIPLPAQNFEGIVYINAVDEAGLKSDTKEVSVKMDNEECLIATVESSSDKWTNEDVVISGSFSDNLSGVKAIKIVKDGKTIEENAIITTTDDGKTGEFTYTVSKQDYEGNYLVYGIDKAENDSKSEISVAVKMDITNPVIETVESDPSDWTNGNVTISGTFSDNLSDVKEVKYKRADATDFTDVDTLDIENKKFSFTITAQDYEGDYVVYCTDNAGNKSEEKNVKVYMDITAPSDVEISYSTPIGKLILSKILWFYNPDCTVTLSSTDAASGIASFTYSYTGSGDTTVTKADTGFTTFTIPAQFRGNVTAKATDIAGNETLDLTDTTNEIVVDTITPKLSVSYTSEAMPSFYKGTDYTAVADMADADKVIYSKDVKATITVEESSFFEGEQKYTAGGETDGRVHQIGIQLIQIDDNGAITKTEYLPMETTALFTDNDATVEFDWTNSGDVHTFSIDYDSDFDYRLIIDYPNDFSDNATEIVDQDTKDSAIEGTKTYESKLVTIDKTAPVINVEYNPSLNIKTTAGKKYFPIDKRVATISIMEHNFDVGDNYLDVKITSKNADGSDVKESEITKILADIHDSTQWVSDIDNPNIHTFIYEYSADSNYTFNIGAKDLAKNVNRPVTYKDGEGISADAPNEFTLDVTAPIDVRFGFKKTALSKILNILTFGVFFNGETKVRIEAQDITAGLWKADISIKDLNGNDISVFDETVKEFEDDGSKGSVEFTITKDKLEIIKEFQGTISIKIYDKAENIYENIGEIYNGTIKLTKSVKPIDNEIEEDINNYIVFESDSAHTEHSSISVESKQAAVSTQTKQTDVDLSNYIKDEYLEDAEMAYKRNAPLYNGSVDYTVEFIDDYSGIAKAQVFVYDNNSGQEYLNSSYDLISPSADSNKVKWAHTPSSSNAKIVEGAKATFTVDQNANDIVIVAIIHDNAGNVSYDYYNFGIDTIKPKIDYSFTTNNQNTKSGSYYSKETIFTINVSERNFPLNTEIVGNVTYKVNGVEKSKTLKGKDFELVNEATSYSDNQKYSYTLSSLKDEGQYEDFAFVATDRAENENSISPKTTFYYDYTLPVIKITKDEHKPAPQNTYFYQDSRVLTITVTDRYFAENMFKYNSKAGTYKFVSDSEAGEKYHTKNRTFTYTFTYTTNTSIDCALTNLAATDKAGNAARNIPTVTNGSNFVVDGKKPQKFTSVVTTPKNQNGVNVSGSDYKVFVEDDIKLTITSQDENLSHASISNTTLTCRSLSSDGRTKNVEFKLTKVSGSRDKIVYSVTNLDQDGFYELSYTITDDSGKVSDVQRVSFAICRNGAIFNKDELDKITNSEETYNANSVESISFTQYSASSNTRSVLEISSDSVQFPRRILELGTDYVIKPEASQDSETMVYKSIYNLLRHAFELENGVVLDGVYTIKVTPVTKGANGITSDNAPSQTFTVTLDATDPTLVANLDYTTSYKKVFENVAVESDKEYKIFANNATVTFNLNDSYSGIDESTVEATWNGQELEIETCENGDYAFVLSSNNPANGNEIIIGALDNAGNKVNISFTVELDRNFWLYVTLGGFGTIGILAIVILLIARRRKLNRSAE